jgi:Secretion system C-terminal sorting domain
MKQTFIFSLLFFVSYNSKSQVTISLSASKDAAIGYHDGANTANNNYGTAIQNAAYCIPATAAVGVNVNRALIDFNLTTIPANAVIISANLNLYALGPFGSLPGHTGSNNTSTIERVIQNWQENTVTWNNQPSTTTQNASILNQSSGSTQNYLNINVTSLVQDMKNNPSTSFGFKLKLITEATTNCLAFGSKDHSNANFHPSLIVTYSVATTNTICSNTATLISDYDAAIGYHDGANTANNNYGTAAQNAAYAIPAVASSGLNVNRALIHFNLTTIPANATITNAKLDLYAYGPVSSYPGHAGSNNNAVIERVTSNWTENTVTWNTQPTSTSINQIPVNGTTNPTLDYLNINVTPVIQDIFTAPANNGVVLKLVTEAATNLLFFCSEDHPDNSKHPRLTVTYTCSQISSVKEKTEIIANVSCYPNPTQDVIYFNIESLRSGKGKIVIMDVQGKQINEISLNLENNLTNHLSINTQSLKSGVYFYTIQFENEQKTGKFIIQ